MKHLVLYVVALCALDSSGYAQGSPDVFAIDRMTMCRALERVAQNADRHVRVVLPEKSSLVTAVSVNVRVPHKFAVMHKVARDMKRVIEADPRGKNMSTRERLKLSLIMGCSHPSVGEFVSYASRADIGPEHREFKLPVAKGTPYPLNINVCGRDKAGKALCLYGVAFEEWEDTIFLTPKL